MEHDSPTLQALGRRDPQRRYPILLTLLAQSATDVLDEVVGLFDQAISAREGKAERKMRDALAERGKSGEAARPCSTISWTSSSTWGWTTNRSAG